eukprot:TRINITY_DN21843_c1_g1_i1.p1 TRINITY_DN21843_c1_g1~~TRINITY_DN21843_c1_g1_i1.p1  ORF type:complete len:360 (+),score=38.95 TRINITY_DN21843_c1_g1_i1:50-1129(+)
MLRFVTWVWQRGRRALEGPLDTIRGLASRFFGEVIEFPSGQRVSVGKLLAEGGFSYVYVARDLSLGTHFALKKMICQDSSAKNSAQAEAEVHARFSHENILPIVNKVFGRHPANRSWEVCWLVFPLCRCSLRDEISRLVLEFGDVRGGGKSAPVSPWTPAQAMQLVLGMCYGLQEMHRAGVAHRDIKPENVLLHEASNRYPYGRPMLMDFGSCGPTEVKIQSRREALQEQETASNLCTMQYRAPELFDVPTDIGVLSYSLADCWAVGCTGYCCLMGYSPFEVEFDQRPPYWPRQVDTSHLRTLAAIPWPKAGAKSLTPEPIKEALSWMLTANPKARPDLRQMIDRLSNIPRSSDVYGAL